MSNNIGVFRRTIRAILEEMIANSLYGLNENVKKRIESHNSLSSLDARGLVLHMKRTLAEEIKKSKAWWTKELLTVCFEWFRTFDDHGCLRVEFNFSTRGKLTRNNNKMQWIGRWNGRISFILFRDLFPFNADALFTIHPEFVEQMFTDFPRTRVFFACLSVKQDKNKKPNPPRTKKTIVKKSGTRRKGKNAKTLNNKRLSNIMGQLKL